MLPSCIPYLVMEWSFQMANGRIRGEGKRTCAFLGGFENPLPYADACMFLDRILSGISTVDTQGSRLSANPALTTVVGSIFTCPFSRSNLPNRQDHPSEKLGFNLSPLVTTHTTLLAS